MSEPLFPEPEPGEHPAQRVGPEGQHPWAPSVLDGCEHSSWQMRRIGRGMVRQTCDDCGESHDLPTMQEGDDGT
jgi:hypothetical protein